jgi:hypothetical protein
MNVTESTGASVAVTPEDERHSKASTLPRVVLRPLRHCHAPTPCHHRPTDKGARWVVLWAQFKGIPKLRFDACDMIVVYCSSLCVCEQSPRSRWVAWWAQFGGVPKSRSDSRDMITVCCSLLFVRGQSPQPLWIALWAQFGGVPKSRSDS